MEPEQIKTYVSLSQGTSEGKIIESIVPVSCVEDEHFLPDTSNCHLLTGSWKLRKKAKSNPEMQEAKKNSNELIKEGLRNLKQSRGFNQQIIQSLSHVQLFATPWTAACQASLSFTVSRSWLKLMSIELITISSSVAPFSSGPQSVPVSGSFPISWLFASDGQSIGISASASVLPMYIQGWFLLWLIGLISLQSKGLSSTFFNTTAQKHQFFSAQLSLLSNSHIHMWYWKNHRFDYTDLCLQSDAGD